MKYFSNLPVITYANNFVRNILSRAKIVDEFKNNQSTYYPYVLKEGSASGLRLENLSFDYYDDIDNVWIVHLANEIVDPYYDAPLTGIDFEAFLTKKYGSLRKAYQTVKFYRNNYDQDDRILTISGYTALPSQTKKYWTPSVNFDNNIIGYERIKDDTIITTNKILTLDVTLSGNAQFQTNEKVIQDTSGATGFITFSNTTVISVQHITGTFSNNATYYITGQDSSANASPSTITTIKENLTENEIAYFSPVTAYDYENELNESKKTIILIDSKYTGMIQSAFNQVMNQ
jgi:hypothetical protein